MEPNIKYLVIIISIHAPSRERHYKNQQLIYWQQFQSTLPHGSDVYRVFIQGGVFVFQSTLPHGSDFQQNQQLLG